MALYSLYCAEVPLRNCSLTHPEAQHQQLVVTTAVYSGITVCVRVEHLRNIDYSLSVYRRVSYAAH